MDPIVLFLKNDILSEEKGEADKVRKRAPRFWLSEDQKLYKCSFSGLYLLCIHPKAVDPLLEELHEGICGSHTWGKSLSYKALTQGYWWPNMQKETQEYVRSVTNVRGMPQRFISQGVSSILCLAPDLLLNGFWTL